MLRLTPKEIHAPWSVSDIKNALRSDLPADGEEDRLMNRKPEETKAMTEYVGAIEKQTLQNMYFRQVLFTAQHSQLVVMCLRPGEEIGDEVHSNVDQFFRIEQGDAKFVFNERRSAQYTRETRWWSQQEPITTW